MKVTIDLDKLLGEGKINQAEYDKFSQLSARHTAAVTFNILVGFGVIAVCGSTLVLLPHPKTAVGLGLFICGAGMALVHARYEQWIVLANTCVVVGALLFGGGLIVDGQGSSNSFWIVTATFAGAGVFARSSFLTVLAVLVLSSGLGASTDYVHAAYFLGVEEPALTAVFFSIFAIATFQLSKRIATHYRNIAIAASRTGVLLVNFGFWIGSLWGDHNEEGVVVVADWVFATLWAIALIVAGAWAWKRNRRWLVNAVAVFGSIHFYTQWFERLDASPVTLLMAGLLALGFAIGLRALNVKLGRGPNKRIQRTGEGGRFD